MAKTILITGCSSGLGRGLAELFAASGWNVAATMRKPTCPAGQALAALPNVLVTALDVMKTASVTAAVAAATAKFGGIDAVVNNAGFATVGPLEVSTEWEMKAQFDTNVLGVARVMQAVLPGMRAAGAGAIVNISSVGGKVVLPLSCVYTSSKYALEGLSETAALELAPFGIRVKIVEPGFVATDFGRNMKVSSSEEVTAYNNMMEGFMQGLGAMAENGSKVEDIAKVVMEAVLDESDKLRFPAGPDAHALLKKRMATSDEDHLREVSEMFKLKST